MATQQGLVFEGLERQWLAKAVEVLRVSLIRSRSKELPGSEIHALRGKEIDSLTMLLNKLQ